MATIKNKYSSTVTNSIPLAPSSLQYGEIAFNIATGYESIFLKNSGDTIITLNDWTHILSKPTTMTGYGLNDFTAHSATLVGTVAGATVLDVRGTSGLLFSVTDSLVGSLLTISDISGIPIFDVNSSGLVDIDGDLLATGEITAYGLGNGSVAYAYNRLDTWTGYTTAFDEYVLSAKLGWELHEKPAYAITSTNITNWGTAYSHVSDINNPHGVTPTLLGLIIGTNVLAYRTFGSAANSATTDFVAYRTFGTAANSATTDFATAAQGTDARTPTAHAFIDSTGHTASGLTTGHFLKATGATTYGFAAHGLSYGDVDAEQAFTKNTGFNKNFGTTTGTVLEGRTFGTAAASNVGDFIQNQSTSALTASVWITGSIVSNSEITAYGTGTSGSVSYDRLDTWGSYDINKATWVLSAYLGNDLYTSLNTHTGLTTTAHGLGASAFHADSFFITASLKGVANGVAELDSNGFVKNTQLPSYVDDVIEVADVASLPATGETGKIYIVVATGVTYRWSGTAYAEISASLALGETSATAYRGDRGKDAYDHSQNTTSAIHGATTLGYNLLKITNPSAITFSRFNADNTVSSLGASDFRTAIGLAIGTDVLAQRTFGTAADSATGDFLAAGATAVNSALLENHNAAYFQIAGSYAPTSGSANYILNQIVSAQTANMWISGAINGSSSVLNNLTAGVVVLDVRGTNGQLFSVTDSLVGDIFTVSDISGIPIFNVNSNGTIDADGDFIATGEVTAYGVGTGTTAYAYDRLDTWSYDAGKVNWVLSAYLGNDLYTRPSYAITSTNITNWNSAFGWENHASSGYLTGITKAQIEAALTGAITTHTHAYVEVNTAITAATKTKISYDAKGLVTGGGDATTADIADSTDKRYVTDAHLTILGNTSNTNSGDAATNSQYSALITSKTAKHVYAAPNAADGVPGFRVLVASDIPSLSYASTIHNLIDTTNHPVTGLTDGHFLKATGATTYGFAAHGLGASDVGARADTWLPPNDHVAATVSTTNGLSISGQEISLALSSTSANGALSSTDWNTFNAKQSVLTGTATSVTATTTLYTLATSSGKTMVVDYYIINSAGTAQRGGTQVITWTSTLLSYTETSTTDIGLTTNAVQMIPVIDGTNLLVQAAISSGTWSIKVSVRYL